MFWAQGPCKEPGFHLQAALPCPQACFLPGPGGGGHYLLRILVAEYLGVVAVQLEDDPVHLLLTEASMAHQERCVLDQPVTVGLL